jgi:sec-independent protein translocase protein TatC
LEIFKKNIEQFLPFLEDLRRRVYHGVILFAVVFLLSLFSTGIILRKLFNLINLDEVTITASSPFQFTDVAMNVGFFIAIMVSVPYIIYSFYCFVLPALSKSEKIKLFKYIPISIGLFVVGFSYGFFILTSALNILAAINVRFGIANYWNISLFLSQVSITSALLGLVFEFPIFLTLFIKLGMITPEILKNNRRIAYFITLCLTALLPPTDGLSLIAMTLPLVLLYEGTIFINNR